MIHFRCYQMAKTFYQEGRKLKLKGESRSQFEWASLSIALNLMEGSARSTRKERSRFFQIAYGSARECMAILDLHNISVKEIDILCASIYRLLQSPGPGPSLPAARVPSVL